MQASAEPMRRRPARLSLFRSVHSPQRLAVSLLHARKRHPAMGTRRGTRESYRRRREQGERTPQRASHSAARRCASEPFSVIPCPPRATRQPGAAPVFATRLRAAAGRAVFFGGGAMKRGTERLTREVRRGARAGATEGAIAPTSWRAGARANEGARASAPCVARTPPSCSRRARGRGRGRGARARQARRHERASGRVRAGAAESPRPSPRGRAPRARMPTSFARAHKVE